MVALNFLLDTLLFCGAILLLANSIDRTSGGADLVLNHPLGARAAEPAMTPASIVQRQSNNPNMAPNMESPVAGRKVTGADRFLPVSTAPQFHREVPLNNSMPLRSGNTVFGLGAKH